jgi:CRISP-associated protein Cas1
MANRWTALYAVYASGSRNASHPVNAILNYAYAVLQSQVQIKLLSEGYEPMLGIMHSDRDDGAAFVFDMMEPERPKVDQATMAFLKSEALHPADFTIREDGVVRLNPELAKRVTGLTTIGVRGVTDGRAIAVANCGGLS